MGGGNKDRCIRYGSNRTWNTCWCVLLVFSHPQQVKPVWLCFELHQNHHFPALRYVVCIRPSVFAFILHPQGLMLLGEISSVVQRATPSHRQRLVTFPQLVSPSASITLLCPTQQWVVKGRILPLGFRVGDSFDIWTVLQGDFESH